MSYGKLAWLTKEELEDLYITQHLTMQEIADMFSVTRAGVLKALNRNGVDKSKAERFDVPCVFCKEPFNTTRKKFKSATGLYCSSECYHNHRRSVSNYKPSRQGQRMARNIMAKHLHRDLLSTEVVHHEDGDNTNNHIDNLLLFTTQSEHLRYHHLKRIKAIS